MVNWWFGALWFGIRIRYPYPFHRGDSRNPNHRAPNQQFNITLRIRNPPMQTPDPPNDIPGALKQVVLTPHDIPSSLRDISLYCLFLWALTALLLPTTLDCFLLNLP